MESPQHKWPWLVPMTAAIAGIAFQMWGPTDPRWGPFVWAVALLVILSLMGFRPIHAKLVSWRKTLPVITSTLVFLVGGSICLAAFIVTTSLRGSPHEAVPSPAISTSALRGPLQDVSWTFDSLDPKVKASRPFLGTSGMSSLEHRFPDRLDTQHEQDGHESADEVHQSKNKDVVQPVEVR